jgi:hypothetical protein
MEWKSIFNASEKEIQRSIEEKGKEIKLREEGLRRAENISLRVRDVADYFKNIIKKKVASDGAYSAFSTLDPSGSEVMRLIDNKAITTVSLLIHPSCSICTKEIIGG